MQAPSSGMGLKLNQIIDGPVRQVRQHHGLITSVKVGEIAEQRFCGRVGVSVQVSLLAACRVSFIPKDTRS